MKKIISAIALSIAMTAPVHAGMEDDPLLTMFMLDEFETSNDDESTLTWNAQLWIGKDLNKFWFKTEGEQVDGETEESEFQFLYSKAIAPFWDFQVGARQDTKASIDSEWLVVGFEGLAPYYFETEAMLFIGESGQSQLRLSTEYEFMFTQKLVFSPEIEANIYGKDDVQRGLGSGLSDIEIGLRLRYEIRREIAPYIGVTWHQLYAGTADIAESNNAETSDTAFVIGIRAWF